MFTIQEEETPSPDGSPVVSQPVSSGPTSNNTVIPMPPPEAKDGIDERTTLKVDGKTKYGADTELEGMHPQSDNS